MLEVLQEGGVEGGGVLHLGRVACVGKLDQLRVRNGFHGRPREHRIVAQ